VLWTLWHVPMFVLTGLGAGTIAFLVLFFVPASVVFTWLYAQTRGSLLLAVLMHVGAHLDNGQRALPADVTPAVAHTVAYAVFALALVFAERRAWGLSAPSPAVASDSVRAG